MHRMDPHAHAYTHTRTHTHTHTHTQPSGTRKTPVQRYRHLPGALWAPCHPQVTGLLVAVDLLA